jgi:hypothetical protein
MIKLTGLISAIRNAIDSASQIVANENLSILKSFFQEGPADDIPEGDRRPDFLASENGLLKPKMVAMQYPKDTADGIVQHNVLVPLISLAPITNLQPSEIKIEIDLEFLEQNDDVIVGFPQIKKTMFGSEKTYENKPNAKLTMTVNAVTRPAGVTAVVEGYDKILRAQIPH